MTGAVPWLLLRGLTRERGHWGDLPERLAERLGGAPVVAIDLPGNGARHAERSPASVDALASDCRGELARRGIAAPVHVLALSLGAMVTVAWAARWPQELAGAVLVNTSLRPFSPFWQRLRPAAWGPLLRLAAGGAGDAVREATVLRLTSRGPLLPNVPAAAPPSATPPPWTEPGSPASGPPPAGRPSDATLLAHWCALRRAHPVTRANAARQLWAAGRYRAPRVAPPIAWQLLASERDGLVDPRCSHALARAWQCPIAVHPQAGHDLPLDDGGWVVEQVARFARAHGTPPSAAAVR